VAEDEVPPPEPAEWPAVSVVVPARNEAAILGRTLPALRAQDYPGDWEIVLVDDRSEDGTATLARELDSNARLTRVLAGNPLPPGWAGKVWALEQGVRAAASASSYPLLTDADIWHAPGSLRRLVAESEAASLGLNSRMARLRCDSWQERLLIPPFVFFFNLLYPMRSANDSNSRVAAAAGGCVLLRRRALELAGGLAAIAGEVIDDVNLARKVKAAGQPIRLSLSRSDVVSLREYGSIAAVWRMVRRTAFDELRYSWLRLAATLAGLLVLFAAPPGLVVCGVALGPAGVVSPGWAVLLGSLGLLAWVLLAAVFLPAVRYFGLKPLSAAMLPVAGILYGGMTLDSGRCHLTGRARSW
jgi:hopene-associated glycosyltransferase HpnB